MRSFGGNFRVSQAPSACVPQVPQYVRSRAANAPLGAIFSARVIARRLEDFGQTGEIDESEGLGAAGWIDTSLGNKDASVIDRQ